MSNSLSKLVFKLTVFVMALTGVAQMPIFKRYYISDLPGLGWLADFYLTNKIHYIFAALLLFLSVSIVTEFFLAGKRGNRLTPLGMLRVGLYLAVMVTGIMRVIKNLAPVTLDPYFVMFIDWTHLLFCMLLGVAAMVAFFRGRVPYLEPVPGVSAGRNIH